MLKFALHLPDCWNLLDVVTVVSLLAFILIMCPPHCNQNHNKVQMQVSMGKGFKTLLSALIDCFTCTRAGQSSISSACAEPSVEDSLQSPFM